MLKRVVYPGEVLRDELAEFGVTPTAFARQIDVPPNRVSQIIAGNPDRRLSDYRVDLGEHRASWALRTVIDVALARDITVQHHVAVTVD